MQGKFEKNIKEKKFIDKTAAGFQFEDNKLENIIQAERDFVNKRKDQIAREKRDRVEDKRREEERKNADLVEAAREIERKKILLEADFDKLAAATKKYELKEDYIKHFENLKYGEEIVIDW